MKKKTTLFQINDYSLGLRDVVQFAVALVFFLGLYYTMSNTLQTQGEQLRDLRSNVSSLSGKVNDMNERLARIEGSLGIRSSSSSRAISPIPLAQLNPTPVVVNIQPSVSAGQSATVTSSEPTPAPSPHPTPSPLGVEPTPVITEIPTITLPIIGRIL